MTRRATWVLWVRWTGDGDWKKVAEAKGFLGKFFGGRDILSDYMKTWADSPHRHHRILPLGREPGEKEKT